jgi:hypothetical protein
MTTRYYLRYGRQGYLTVWWVYELRGSAKRPSSKQKPIGWAFSIPHALREIRNLERTCA